MSNFPIIDQESIENLRSLNPGDNDEFLKEIVGIFLEDTPQRIEELDLSLASQDKVRFTRAAHSIKGSSANLGALALRAAAEKLEIHSNNVGLTEVVPLIAEIKSQFALAKAELKKLTGTA
jgi:histidine phosphotransfer protein HptB